ncbi:MAG: response regulator transcription factor [Reichenbachiella sp.]
MKVLILDDHLLFANGLVKMLETKYPGLEYCIFSSLKDIQSEKLNFELFDLVISDIELPGENIFDFLEVLRKSVPKLPVLIVSMHNKLSVIKKCQELSLEGYILKDDQEIEIAIEAVLNGKNYFSMKIINTLSLLDRKEQLLSSREEEIVQCIAEGMINLDIAEKLFVSESTIKTHRKNIHRKLGVSNTAELTKYYYENYIK